MHEYYLQETTSGRMTLIFRDKARQVRLHSAYDPVREAERAVESFNPGKADLILVCGCALGYHLTLLRKRFPSCCILLIERDMDVLEMARKINPESLQELVLIQGAVDLQAFFESYDLSTFKGTAVYRHRPSYLLDQDYYDRMSADINQYLSSKLSDLLTRFEFEGKWIENIVQNLHHVFSAVPVIDLFGKFSGYPGIIVSAGPSLKKNIGHISRLKDRVLIVAVDTALKVLLKHGMEPHIVMTLDAQRHSIKHFLGIPRISAALLADMVSYPRILQKYPGPRIISTTSKYYNAPEGDLIRETTPVMDWIEEYIRPIGDIQSGGSVATSAFDLLLNLGCDPIILTGQDLAYTGREIHCTGTHHNEEWLPRISRFVNLDTINQNVVRKRKIKLIPAYGNRDSVISDFVFDLYRGWFEDSAAKVSIDVINATEGGARIINTRELSLEDLASGIPPAAQSPQAILTEILNSSQRQDAQPMLSALDNAISDIHILLNSENEEETDLTSPANSIRRFMEKETTIRILAPFLRKTQIYLARHPEIGEEKAMKMQSGDILAAAKRILPHLIRARNQIQSPSGE